MDGLFLYDCSNKTSDGYCRTTGCINLTASRTTLQERGIKPVEQEDVFKNIREEIESEIISHSGTGEEVIQAYVDGLLKAIKIIDKYRERQENE